MKTPLDLFIGWLKSINKEEAETIVFLAISYYPHFEQKTQFVFEDDKIAALDRYLKKLSGYEEITGMALFLLSTVSLIVKDYDNMEQALNRRDDMDKLGDRAKELGRDDAAFRHLKESSAKRYYRGKEVKESWQKFQKELFNLDTIDDYQKMQTLQYLGRLKR